MKSVIGVVVAVVNVTQAVAEEQRQAGAHEHGQGVFQMVVEGDHAVIELAAPSFDLIGFEHAPSTPEQRVAMADAAALLSRPDTLFAMPDGAGCAIGEIEIAFGATRGDDSHGDHEGHDHGEHKHDDDHDEDAHSEVTASYHLACGDTGAIDRVTFGYFDAFPNAVALEVVILSEAGQNAGDVNRDNAVFEIE